MEPKERKTASEKRFIEVKEKLAQLDGHMDGADFLEYTKDFGSSGETYKELTKSLKRIMGLYLPKCEKMTIDPKVENLSQSTVDRMRRAIYILNN